MARSQAGDPHSGWAFQQEADATLRLVSLCEASLANRAIIPFLALPTGSVVKREGAGYAVSAGGRDASPLSSQLLARLGEAKAFS